MIYDVSVPIHNGMPVWPSDPPVKLTPSAVPSKDGSHTVRLTSIEMGSHTGTHLDAPHHFVDGGRTYRLTVPLPVPAGLFWSVTIYDAATRSEIQFDQDKAALRSLFELRESNTKGSTDDRSIDLYFAPKAPSGKENRWIKTIPGKGWFAYFRVYGPQQPAFNGSWKPGDFEELK